MSDIDIAEDLLLVDNTQTVTLTLKRSREIEVEIEHANNGPLSKSQESSYNGEGNAYAWTIPDAELNASEEGYEIRPQDELYDGLFTYVVISAINQACGGKWNLVTNRKK